MPRNTTCSPAARSAGATSNATMPPNDMPETRYGPPLFRRITVMYQSAPDPRRRGLVAVPEERELLHRVDTEHGVLVLEELRKRAVDVDPAA